MFDFRYHALSLGAVFLALGVGILLGVTIGDSLVSQADRGLRGALRNDVVQARNEAEDARRGIDRRDQIIKDAFPSLVRGRLLGQRVALVSVRSMPDGMEARIKDTVEAGGGNLDSVTVFELPDDAGRLAEAAGGRFTGVGTDTELVASLARRIGISLARGGRLVRRLETEFPKRFKGDYGGVSSVVLYRSPPPEVDATDDRAGAERKTRESFEKALVDAFKDEGATVAGVEESRTDPSQVPWYRDRGISSVDSTDDVAGRLALVYVLEGKKEGAFGLKPGADRAGPEPPAP